MSNVHIKFAGALQHVERLVKDSTADTGKYVMKYADINQILETLKPVLSAAGLALSQPLTTTPEGNLIVTTLLVDTDTGETLTFGGPGFPLKADPQQAASAITYFRRYSLVSLFALQADDDDAGVAHRGVAQVGKRTPAENEIRSTLAGWDRPKRDEFAAEFRTMFGSSLSDLPESRHGDALTFTKTWAPKNGESEAQ